MDPLDAEKEEAGEEVSRPGWNERDCAGYLTKAPELKTSSIGTPYTNITIGCPVYWKKETVTEWAHATLYGSSAEFCCKYARKGDFVRIAGTQITRKFTKDGIDKEWPEIQANVFMILSTAIDRSRKEKKEEEDVPI